MKNITKLSLVSCILILAASILVNCKQDKNDKTAIEYDFLFLCPLLNQFLLCVVVLISSDNPPETSARSVEPLMPRLSATPPSTR